LAGSIRSKLTISVFLNGTALLCASAACSRIAPTRSDRAVEGGSPTASPSVLAGIARAEDLRRSKELPPDVEVSHDATVRRAAARALARILDLDDSPLLRALEDDDEEVAAWAGYGLGEACRGREASHVQALAARLVSLSPAAAGSEIDPAATLVRAIGRCGGERAEPTLRAWLRSGGRVAEAAAYALGDVAATAGSLSLETSEALLSAAKDAPPLAAALYPFGRVDGAPPDEVTSRLVSVAREALDRPAVERIFAVRALGRAGDPHAVEALSRVLSSDDYSPPERVEAAKALARLRKAGQVGLGDALAVLASDGPTLAQALGGDRFGVLLATLDALGEDPAKPVETPLWTVARLDPGPGSAPARVRRASALRCLAAEKLARGAWDSDILGGCDLGDGVAGGCARLSALDRSPFDRIRRAAWVDLVRSPHVAVREAALGIIARHPELGAEARAAIAAGLSANEPGVVATAASLVQSHPDRVFVLAASERHNALDPGAPPPSPSPARELDRAVAGALRSALARTWSDDLVQTRVALVDAALTVGIDEGRAYAKAACEAASATVRARAAKALAAAGQKDATCPAPEGQGDPAPEIGHALERIVRVVFDTDGRSLTIRFDPMFAPIAATRLVGLARSGFYTGLTIHRVVPGFVAQLGDRGADGFGGSGDLLRCETSPVPFGPLDVGVALAGRDTGSSQIFVTLARSPHLDGEYAWVGHADGDWNAVAEGEVVREVRVEP
jgi:cyclophilin family peptidyl-prolyl cis-trans isomerase